MTFKVKLVITFSCYFAWFTWGIANSIVPDTLLDIADNLNVTFKHASYGFVIGSATFIVAVLTIGFVFEKVDKVKGFIAALIFYSVVIFYIPFVTSLSFFYFTMAIISVINSSIDVVGTYWIVNLWRNKNNLYMQGLHFSFSVGMTITPLMCAPFMRSQARNLTQSTNTTTELPNFSHEQPGNDSTPEPTIVLPHLFVPYTITSGLLVVSFGFSTLVYIFLRETNRPSLTSIPQENLVGNENSQTPVLNSTVNSKVAVLLGSLLLFFHMGTEGNCNTFIVEFVTFLGNERKVGAYEASLLLTFYSIFRFISIFTAGKLPVHVMIFLHLTIVLSSAVMMFFLAQSSLMLLSITFATFGIGASSLFPSIYAYLGVHLTMSSKLTGIFVASSASANIFIQLLNGHFLQSHPMSFVYINLFTVTASLITFALLHLERSMSRRINSSIDESISE